MGLPDLVCRSPAEYVERAVALGRDRGALEAYRRTLLDRRDSAVLFDTPRLVRHLEHLYRAIAADVAAGRLPQPDLTNLDIYHEIGAALDHDTAEHSWTSDYAARDRNALAERHAFAPIPPDKRLWARP